MAQTENGPERPVLYVAGDEFISSIKGVAMVWKIDGSTVTPIPLTDGKRNVSVSDIAESGGNIYAAGWEGENYRKKVAMVWKIDGSGVTPIPLTDGKQNMSAYHIAAGGGVGPERPPILYAAGYEENSGGKYAAKVWKIDGSTVTTILLTDGKRPSSAGAVIVLESEP
jgi:hypothetical protein